MEGVHFENFDFCFLHWFMQCHIANKAQFEDSFTSQLTADAGSCRCERGLRNLPEVGSRCRADTWWLPWVNRDNLYFLASLDPPLGITPHTICGTWCYAPSKVDVGDNKVLSLSVRRKVCVNCAFSLPRLGIPLVFLLQRLEMTFNFWSLSWHTVQWMLQFLKLVDSKHGVLWQFSLLWDQRQNCESNGSGWRGKTST